MRPLLISVITISAIAANAMPLRNDGSDSSAGEKCTHSPVYNSAAAAAAAAADDDLSFGSPPTATQIELTCVTSRTLLRSLARFLRLLPDSDLNKITQSLLDSGVIRYLDLARLHAHFALRIQGIQVHPQHRANVMAAIQQVAIAFQDAYLELDTDDDSLLAERMENSRIENQTLLALKCAAQEERRARAMLAAPRPLRTMLPSILSELSHSGSIGPDTTGL